MLCNASFCLVLKIVIISLCSFYIQVSEQLANKFNILPHPLQLCGEGVTGIIGSWQKGYPQLLGNSIHMLVNEVSDELNFVPDGIAIHARSQEGENVVFRRLVFVAPAGYDLQNKSVTKEGNLLLILPGRVYGLGPDKPTKTIADLSEFEQAHILDVHPISEVQEKP